MDTWEYLTTTLEADTENTPVGLHDDVPTEFHPRYSVYSLIPQLNQLGAKGWELLSLEPVQVGRKGDVRYCDAASGAWTYNYFATFKRKIV